MQSTLLNYKISKRLKQTDKIRYTTKQVKTQNLNDKTNRIIQRQVQFFLTIKHKYDRQQLKLGIQNKVLIQLFNNPDINIGDRRSEN